jgi:thiamine-monophosphate kinase
MAGLSERALIALIREASGAEAPGLLRGIGDDCAVFTNSGAGPWLISTDSLVEGVHFERRRHPPELLGRKCIAVNFSDIAAMGGCPRFVLLSLCLPSDLDADWILRFLSGVRGILAEYGAVLIGGDTVRSKELMFSVTVIGEAGSGGILYRSGASPGDIILVSGPLGSAAAGLALLQKSAADELGGEQWPQWQALLDAHLDPLPQVKLGQELSASGWVTAMQDISDGLATDLAHICQESGTGAIIHARSLPSLPVLDAAAMFLEQEKLDLLLRGGEDYQLVFTVPPQRVEELTARLVSSLNQQIFAVGVISEGRGVLLENKDGSRTDISFQGYEH